MFVMVFFMVYVCTSVLYMSVCVVHKIPCHNNASVLYVCVCAVCVTNMVYRLFT